MATKSTSLKTPEFRVAMAAVFEPYNSKDDPKPLEERSYLIRALFPHPSKMAPAYKTEYDAFLAELKARANAAILAKWGPDKTKYPSQLRSPFRDQGEKSFDGWEAGALWFTTSKKYKDGRPGLVGSSVDANGVLLDIKDPSEFYAGCYARCSLDVYAYSRAGNNGVAFGLVNIQKTRDGESLSGRMKAQDEFQPVAGAGMFD